MPPRQKTAVVAGGGKSSIIDADHKSIPDQYAYASITAGHVADMIEQGWEVINEAIWEDLEWEDGR